jgi:hypothetical protein
MTKALTVTKIAEALELPRRRVEYIMLREAVKPAVQAGPVRVYDAAVLDLVRSVSQRMDRDRPAGL